MWRALSGDRPVGMSTGPIPFAAIDRYARRFGIVDPDEFDRLVEIVLAMEDAYFAHQAQRRQVQEQIEEAERVSATASTRPPHSRK